MANVRMVNAGDALLEQLLLTGGDPAVKALVPALLDKRHANRYLCMRLLKRGPLLYPVVAHHIARLSRTDLIEVLSSEEFLPEEVMLAILAEHGKAPKVVVALCKRSDLTERVGLALAKRRSNLVTYSLQSNQYVPAVARWKVSIITRRLECQNTPYDGDGFARAYLVARAFTGLGELMYGKVPNPDLKRKTSREGLVSEVFRLLPVDAVAADVAAGLMASDVINAQLLKTWAWRKPTGGAARLLLELADRLPEDTKLHDCREQLTAPYPYISDVQVWRDPTSVDAAWDAGGQWRLVALPSEALDRARLDETVNTSTDQDELAAAALNMSLDATQAATLFSKLDPKRRWRLRAAPLTDEIRVAMLTGDGAHNVAKMMAKTLKRTITPDWFAPWWTKPLAIRALTAAVEDVDVASPLAEKMVAAWPDTLEFALGHVTVRHELGPVVLAELSSRLGSLDDTAAAVVATMLHSWDGALADLVSTAELI